MATSHPTTRRSLFAIVGGIGAAAALPAVAATVQAEPDPWEAWIAGLAIMHPDLPEKAREARAAGYQIGECYCITVGGLPALLFSRAFNDRSQALGIYQVGSGR